MDHLSCTRKVDRKEFWEADISTINYKNPVCIIVRGMLRAKPIEKLEDYAPLTRKARTRLTNKITTLVHNTPGLSNNFIFHCELPETKRGINQKHWFFVEISGYFRQCGEKYGVKEFLTKYPLFLQKYYDLCYEVFKEFFLIKEKAA